MLTYYDYYLAQRERTLSMSSAPRSGQAAASVAGGWWQLAGGWVVSQPAGGQRVRRAACRLVARPDWSAGGWAGGSEGGPVSSSWALRGGRLAGGTAGNRRVAGSAATARRAIRRRFGGRLGGWRAAGGGVL